MSGVVFVVCVPTANYEQVLQYGSGTTRYQDSGKYSANIFSVEVELRDKHLECIPITVNQGYTNRGFNDKRCSVQGNNAMERHSLEIVPMEKILDELLKKLEVEHVAWCGDKNGNYYEVIFPVAAGDPCENILHCLTELGIGKKLNSLVSVLPCSVVYSGLQTETEKEEIILRNSEETKRWKSFVESVRSKLTVKQVVDGVRSGGQLSFDYLLLIVTADCLAALGLVENNSPNIVAAMLVSPLMGPVMSITFGTIIADRELQWVGLGSLIVGMLISCLFGFIFGLILGTTDMPWGFGDWPTEEMKSRGNVRSLWMGVLWALTSGSGVAVALLQGSAGPLIGVAISASLLPPVVNCGLYWALACIWLRYEGVKIPHIKGEEYYGNTSYVPLYSDYIPIEFAINGIVSACLTVVNVICIFITAIVVLKIKEVAAPYTSSPELRRFWQQDLRIVREENRASSMRSAEEAERKEYMMEDLGSGELSDKLDEAVREAIDDDTFRKVQRVSYQTHGPENAAIETVAIISLPRVRSSITENFQSMLWLVGEVLSFSQVARQFLGSSTHPPLSRSASFKTCATHRTSTTSTDLAALDKLVSALLGTQSRDSPIFNHHRVHQSKSFKSKRESTMSNASSSGLATIMEGGKYNRESEGTERSTSWSEKVFNNPLVSNALQGFKPVSQTNIQGKDSLLIADSSNDIEEVRDLQN